VGIQLRDDEIRLRVQQAIGAKVFRPSGSTVIELRQSYKDEADRLSFELTDERYKLIVDDATRSVDELLALDRLFRRFRGKRMLRLLFAKAD